ncbi:MAG: response regulator [Nitrospirae bacterium]|nr:response regulator [Nitrospirota bacterium]
MDTEKKILVIDDEEIVRELLAEVLSESGFQVITAENGLKGLDYFRQPDCRFDLVMVDMSMPGMDGLEVCREMREINPAQKVMMATGSYSSDDELAEMKKNGIDHVIRKPFNLKELVSLLRRELDCS